MEDYTKCVLIGGESPRHSLKHFLTSSMLAVHYTYSNTCYVLLLLLTVSMYTMLSTIEHTIPCCYCGLHPSRVSYSPLR